MAARLLLLAAAFCAGVAGLDFQVLPSPCPEGMEYVTLEEAADNREQICEAMTDWMIAEVAEPGGPGIMGHGYGCNTSQTVCLAPRTCGDAVCKEAVPKPPAPCTATGMCTDDEGTVWDLSGPIGRMQRVPHVSDPLNYGFRLYGNVVPVPEVCQDENIVDVSAIRYTINIQPRTCEQLGPSMFDSPTYSLRKVHGGDPALVFVYTNSRNANVLEVTLLCKQGAGLGAPQPAQGVAPNFSILWETEASCDSLPPPPPPAPRQCFSKTPRGQNLRLNATVTQSETSGTLARSTSHTERFVAEASSGNWASETFAAGGQGCAIEGHLTSCEPPSLTWTKVLYKAGVDVNRTFVISGTVSAGGEGEAVSCYSMDGEADGAIAIYSIGMAWIFSEVEDTTGRRLNCVGEGGVFAVQAGAIQIGFSASTVYEMAQEYAGKIVLPGMTAPNIVIAETATDVPNVPVSVGGVTRSTNTTGGAGLDVSSFQAMYSGWDPSAPPIPEDYWAIPPVCFQSGGWVGQQQQRQQWRKNTFTTLGVKLPRKL